MHFVGMPNNSHYLYDEQKTEAHVKSETATEAQDNLSNTNYNGNDNVALGATRVHDENRTLMGIPKKTLTTIISVTIKKIVLPRHQE
jgi:hypothetical protein